MSAFSFSTADNDFRSLNESEALVVRVQTESPAVIAYEETIRLQASEDILDTKKEKEESTNLFDVVSTSINVDKKISLNSLKNFNFEEINFEEGIVVTAGKIAVDPAENLGAEKSQIVIVGYNGAVSYTHLTLPTTPYV